MMNYDSRYERVHQRIHRVTEYWREGCFSIVRTIKQEPKPNIIVSWLVIYHVVSGNVRIINDHHMLWRATGCNNVVERLPQPCNNLVITWLQPVARTK